MFLLTEFNLKLILEPDSEIPPAEPVKVFTDFYWFKIKNHGKTVADTLLIKCIVYEDPWKPFKRYVFSPDQI